jgi:hypothetical protein
MSWNRYPGGKQISTARGERIKAWFHRRASHRFAFGVAFRAVRFADSRSGWSGVRMEIDLGYWSFSPTILAWKSPVPMSYYGVPLAEQVRRDHKRLEDQEDAEAAEKADQRARLELFDKQLKEWDARHQQEGK